MESGATNGEFERMSLVEVDETWQDEVMFRSTGYYQGGKSTLIVFVCLAHVSGSASTDTAK